MVDDQDLEQIQRELPKRLGLKKHKKYPAELLREILSDPDRREDLQMALSA